MINFDSIRERRRQILDQIGQLEMMRRGSVTDQMLHPKGKGGRRYECGPYTLYTVKREGKTVSKRVSGEERQVLLQQVAACHRFQQLMRELMDLGEQMCELAGDLDAEKKTSNT